MTRRFVDLSIPLDPDVITDPPLMRPTIERQTHRETMADVEMFCPGVTAEQISGG